MGLYRGSLRDLDDFVERVRENEDAIGTLELRKEKFGALIYPRGSLSSFTVGLTYLLAEILPEDAMSSYSKLRDIRVLEESEYEDGILELVVSIKRKDLRDLESLVRERNDEITSLEIANGELGVRILLRSASVEKAVRPLIDELRKLRFIVEYMRATPDVKGVSVFVPPPSPEVAHTGEGVGAISVPLKYKAHLDLCVRVGNHYLS